jgi:hypothetical protein
MSQTALLLDDYLTRHVTEFGHPECSERLVVIRKALEGFKDVVIIPSRRADLAEVSLCHELSYVEGVLSLIAAGQTELAGGDVSVCRESGEVALHAVGGVIDAVDAVLSQPPRWGSAFLIMLRSPRAMHKETTMCSASPSLTGTSITEMALRKFSTRTARCSSFLLISGLGIPGPVTLPNEEKAEALV